MEENIEYIKENYGIEYLNPLIVSKSNKNLRAILPYLQEQGVLELIKNSSTILSLTLDEIQERTRFLESIGETIVNSKGDGFNPIFGLSKNRFAKKVQEMTKRKSTGELATEVETQQENVELLDNVKEVQDIELSKLTEQNKGEE